MSRATVLLIIVLVLILGAVFALSSIDTEVQPVRVEKDVLNEAAAQ